MFPSSTGDSHECHTRCRQVSGVLRQLSSADYSWTYAPCGDLLHPWTRARLPWSSNPHSHPDPYVWGRWRWLPSLSHWSRGETHSASVAGEVEILMAFFPSIHKIKSSSFCIRKLTRPANGSSVRLMTLDLKLETLKSFHCIQHCHHSSSKGSLSLLLQGSPMVQ